MLVGRFLMIVPALAIAGSMVGKKTVPAGPGTFPTNGPLFAVLLVGGDRDRRRAHLLPRARARPGRRALPRRRLEGALAMLTSHGKRRLAVRPVDPEAGGGGQPAQALAAAGGEEPGDVRGAWSARVLTTRGDDPRPGRAASRARRSGSPAWTTLWLWFTVLFANFAEAVAEGRGKAQAATPAEDAQGDPGAKADRWAGRSSSPRRSCARATWSSSRPGSSSRRRRGHRGHRLGRRVGDHRRVGPGDPRERRRPLGGHRRHQGALGPDRGPHHRRAGRVVPRPDDRASSRARRGRRRRTRSRSTSCSSA